MPARSRLQWKRERRAAESPNAREMRLERRRQRRAATYPGRRQTILRRQKRERARARGARSPGRHIQPVNLAHARPIMVCIHLVISVVGEYRCGCKYNGRTATWI